MSSPGGGSWSPGVARSRLTGAESRQVAGEGDEAGQRFDRMGGGEDVFESAHLA
ncbi:MAG: hypothetical protein ACYCVN_07220 [Acidimicrobiales bacterium]